MFRIVLENNKYDKTSWPCCSGQMDANGGKNMCDVFTPSPTAEKRVMYVTGQLRQATQLLRMHKLEEPKR